MKAKISDLDLNMMFDMVTGGGFDMGTEIITTAKPYPSTKPIKKNKIKKDNVVETIEESLKQFLGVDDPYGAIENKCVIEFGDIVFQFETSNLAKCAFYSVQKEAPSQVAIKLVYVSFNGEHSLIMPSVVRKSFLLECLGFQDKTFSSLIRDIGTIQRAELDNRLESLKIAKKSPKGNKVSVYAVNQATEPSKITRPCYPSEILINSFHFFIQSLNETTGTQYQKASDVFMAELEFAAELRNEKKAKGYYNILEAYWTDRQAVTLFCKALNKFGILKEQLKNNIIELLNLSDKNMLDHMFEKMISLVKEKLGDDLDELTTPRIRKLLNSTADFKNLKERLKSAVKLYERNNPPRPEGEELVQHKYSEVGVLIVQTFHSIISMEEQEGQIQDIAEPAPEAAQEESTVISRPGFAALEEKRVIRKRSFTF